MRGVGSIGHIQNQKATMVKLVKLVTLQLLSTMGGCICCGVMSEMMNEGRMPVLLN